MSQKTCFVYQWLNNEKKVIDLYEVIKGKELVIFGTRKGAANLLKKYPFLQDKIIYFVDNDTDMWGGDESFWKNDFFP